MWSYKAAVLAHAKAAFPGNGVGEAKTLSFIGLAVTWLSYITFSLASGATFNCPYHLPFWWNELCLPLIVALLALEFGTFRNLIVWQTMRAYPFRMPYLADLGSLCPTMFGTYKLWDVQFWVWFAMSAPLSIVGHWDLFNTAQMILELYGFAHCHELPSLIIFAQVGWCSMLVQPVMALLLTVKRREGTYPETSFHTTLQYDTNDTYAATTLATYSKMRLCTARQNPCEATLDKFPPRSQLVMVKTEVFNFYLCTLLQGAVLIGVKTAVVMTSNFSWRAVGGWLTTAGFLAYDSYSVVHRVAIMAANAKADSERRRVDGREAEEDQLQSIEVRQARLKWGIATLALSSTLVVGWVVAELH